MVKIELPWENSPTQIIYLGFSNVNDDVIIKYFFHDTEYDKMDETDPLFETLDNICWDDLHIIDRLRNNFIELSDKTYGRSHECKIQKINNP